MTTEHKNLYEDLIETMILDGIKGMTPELRTVIETAPTEKQRELILNFMEENNPEHRLLCGEIRKVVANNKTSEYKHISSLVQMLRQYVKVSDVEVKTMGEVMTPIELVEEMFDTLPYEVWTNPNLKWLDPCNGVGTFVSVIIKRLMKGLETFEPDAELRYKHIMENMIYTAELQSKNVFLYMYAFDPEDRYALNVFNGSYLSEEFDRHMKFWGVEKFDIIVMNPPYQQFFAETNMKSVPLWDKFVAKTINQLVDCGYLVAVHPDSWRRIDGDFNKIRDLLRSKQITYLEVHNITDGLKTFGVQTTYDFYCLHNVPNTMFTKIKCQDGTTQRVDISKMEYIPNGMYKEFEKLIAKNSEEKVKTLYSSSDYGNYKKVQMSKEQTEEHKYPCVYLTYKDGSVNFWYSNTKEKGHFGIPKIIFSKGGASSPIIDERGEYGVMNFAYAIIDEPKNLPFIQKALLHPDFIKLMSFADGITGCRNRYNYKVITLFRKDFWKEFLY